MTLRFVTVKKFTELTGYSAKAVYHKVEGGVWLENHHYRRAPDGRILIDTEGYEAWVRGEGPGLALSR